MTVLSIHTHTNTEAEEINIITKICYDSYNSVLGSSWFNGVRTSATAFCGLLDLHIFDFLHDAPLSDDVK